MVAFTKNVSLFPVRIHDLIDRFLVLFVYLFVILLLLLLLLFLCSSSSFSYYCICFILSAHIYIQSQNTECNKTDLHFLQHGFHQVVVNNSICL